MSSTVPTAISAQVSAACSLIAHHLGDAVLAVHLYGSALDGGLQPHSDIDLLVTLAAAPEDRARQALCVDLLGISAPPGASDTLRALEVTVVVHGDIVPWRYPARRALQFGEWQREDIGADRFEPPLHDPDLAILLTKARRHSVALMGPAVESLFDPVPHADLRRALVDTLALWRSPPDWAGDECNVVLALSRIWYTAATGEIAPKQVAADWAMARLPAAHRPVLAEARQAYLGQGVEHLAANAAPLAAFVHFVRHEAMRLLGHEPAASPGASAASEDRGR